MKRFKKLIALFLTLALMLQVIPVNALAAEEAEAAAADTAGGFVEAETMEESTETEIAEADTAVLEDDTDPYVLGEVEALREENEKHFRMSDGSFIAINYGTPVHYQDESGAWQDIDNTLTLAPNPENAAEETGEVYEAVNGEQTRQFAAAIDAEGYLLSVADGNYSLRMYRLDTASELDMADSASTTAAAARQGAVQAAIASQAVLAAEDQPAEIEAVVENPEEMAVAEDLSQIAVEDAVVPDALSATVTYENVWQDTDLVYQPNGFDVKESILVHAPQASYEYSFRLELEGLTPELQDDGAVNLNGSDGATIYQIPAPYMTDANGAYSDDVHYTLHQSGDDCVLTVTADADWFNDEARAYPVTIDPTIYKEASSSNKLLYTGYVSEATPNTAPSDTKTYVRCGYYSSDSSSNATTKRTIGLIYFNDLPTLPSGSVVTNAQLNLYQVLYSGDASYPRLFTSTFSTTNTDMENFVNTMTWNSLKSSVSYGTTEGYSDKTSLDYIKASASTFYDNCWDITSAVQKWYSKSNEISRLLVMDNCSTAETNARASYSGYGYTTHLPQIIITYRNTVGMESLYDYHTQDVGRAGGGCVNNFTLGLSYSVPICSSPSETLPFSLSLVYNVYRSGGVFTQTTNVHTKDYSTSNAGYGWKTSVQQTVVPIDITGNNSTVTHCMIYTDGDGTEHYFQQNGSTYEDEDGLGMTISVSGGTYTMTDKEKNVWTFYGGYLISYQDNTGNFLYYTYNGNAFSSSGSSWKPTLGAAANQVTGVYRKNDGSSTTEHLVTLEYSDKKLTAVTDQAGRKTTITVSENELTSITFPDGVKASYTYCTSSGAHVLISATDEEANYRVNYTHEYRLNRWCVQEIREQAKDRDGNWINGNGMRAFASNAVYTRFRYYGADHEPETADDIVSQFRFDNWGRTINTISYNADETELLGVSADEYTNNENASKKNNRLLSAAVSGTQSANLLSNAGLEYTGTDLNVWTAQGSGNAAIRTESDIHGSNVENVPPRTGAKLLKLYNATENSTESSYQSVYLTAGKTYVFSAYVNTACSSAIQSGGGAYLTFASGATELARSRVIGYKTNTAIEAGWERLEVSFCATTSGVYRVAANITNMQEVAVFDDLQLEPAVHTSAAGDGQAEVSASSVNLLQCGSFEATESTTVEAGKSLTKKLWSYNASYACPTAGTNAGKTGCIMSFAPGVTGKHRAAQTVPLNCSSNTTFLLSAWGKTAASRMSDISNLTGDNSNNSRFFGLIVKLIYTDTTTPEYQYVAFNDDIPDWQYVCGTVVPKRADKTLQSITVSLACDYNANRAYMDNISLIEEPVQTYTYDSEGNQTLASNGQGKTSTTYDSSNRLTKYTSMSGVSYSLTYSGTNRDASTVTSDGVKITYTYDSAGNVTLSKTQATSGGAYLQSSASYDSTKNFKTSSTDVNGSTTQATYSTTKGLVTSTTAANNTVTNQTYYNNDRNYMSYVSGVAAVVNTYNGNGLISRLARKTFLGQAAQWQAYDFEYNDWGQTTSISIRHTNSEDGSGYSSGLKLADYAYADDGGNLKKLTYGNDQYVEYFYDLFDRLVHTVYYDKNNTVQAEYFYVYNAAGQLARQYAVSGGAVTEEYSFSYDSLGRLIRSMELGADGTVKQRTQHLYDTANRLTSQSWTVGNDTYTESYTYYSGDGSLKAVTTATGDKLTYAYDSLKRLSTATVTNGSGTTLFYTAQNYTDISSSRTTTRPMYYNTRQADGTLLSGNKYEYDAAGNITAIRNSTENFPLLAAYEYDGLNQLTKETRYTYNSAGTQSSTEITYTYDTAGNLLTKTDGSTTSTYTYDNSDWADLLTAFNGQTITY
ncbi:MAG: hypothetical protein ACI3VX_02170, partial [Faecousia sp.]